MRTKTSAHITIKIRESTSTTSSPVTREATNFGTTKMIWALETSKVAMPVCRRLRHVSVVLACKAMSRRAESKEILTAVVITVLRQRPIRDSRTEVASKLGAQGVNTRETAITKRRTR